MSTTTKLARTALRAARRGKRGRSKFNHGTFIPIPNYGNEPKAEVPESDVSTGWTQASRRTGLVARKLGMSSTYDEWGTKRAVTALEIVDCEVVQVKESSTDGYVALQVGAGQRKLKNTSKALQGHFAKAGVHPKKRLQEFHVTEDAVVSPGTPLNCEHFLVGQYVDVQGISKGKGFAGVMKRHNFAGLGASHGVSKAHRSAGSTGQSQDPGRVFKGKKMAGHMGARKCTMKNLRVFQVLPEVNTIVVLGAVPGPKDSWITIRDAKNKPLPRVPPFPTHTEHSAEDPLRNKAALFPKPFHLREDLH